MGFSKVQTNSMFTYGEFVTLTSGKTMIIGKSDTKNIISLEKVNKLFEEGLLAQKTICINGDEVFIDLPKIGGRI